MTDPKPEPTAMTDDRLSEAHAEAGAFGPKPHYIEVLFRELLLDRDHQALRAEALAAANRLCQARLSECERALAEAAVLRLRNELLASGHTTETIR